MVVTFPFVGVITTKLISMVLRIDDRWFCWWGQEPVYGLRHGRSEFPLELYLIKG